MSSLLLVRHGQASFGTDDYDRLSALGTTQARVLGGSMSRQELVPSQVVTGGLRRQQATAAELMGSANWNCDLVTDPGWDEFDHGQFFAANGVLMPVDSRAFQLRLEVGMRSWATGSAVCAEAEPFAAFAARSDAALSRAFEATQEGPTIVVTSAGVISWIAACLLAGDVEQWIRLNRVCVNTAVTKIVAGRSGISMVSFNDHSHLAMPMVTYR